MPVRQSAKCGRLRNSAAVLKPNANFIPDFKLPSLTLTSFYIYILHSTFDQRLWNVWITQLTFFPVFRDITKQILTVSLDQHWKIMHLICAMLPSALGQYYSTLGYNFFSVDLGTIQYLYSKTYCQWHMWTDVFTGVAKFIIWRTCITIIPHVSLTDSDVWTHYSLVFDSL